MPRSLPKPTLQDCYESLTLAELERFEEQLNLILPDDYKAFLLVSNGGDFAKPVVTTDDLRAPSFTYVDHFYGVHTDDENSLQEQNELLEGDLPQGFLTIGSDGMGNHICLAVTGREIGSIWIRDHEVNHSTDWPPNGMVRLNDSCSGFLDSLRYCPEHEWQETSAEFLAAEQGDMEKVLAALEGDFDIESRNDRGETLLVCAASARQSHIVQLLLDRGADGEARDHDRKTALFAAAENGSFGSATALVEAGVNLEAADLKGNTPLLIGMDIDSRVPLYLIQKGANVNHRNNDGESSLDACVLFEDELKGPLLAAGARK